MAGTTQFALYNGALRLLKERRLATTTDSNPARYMLDDVFSGAKAYVLEQGQWSFVSVSTSVSGTASANRGFAYRFTKPQDFVRLISISASSSYYPPLETYAEDATYWFSNESTIYITYVSGYGAAQTATITIASPGVVTATAHGMVAGEPVVLSTSGALPTGLTAGTTHYVKTVLTADTLTLTASYGGTVIATSGTQSGVHQIKSTTGGDLTKWPETYSRVVEAWLSLEIAPHLTKGTDLTNDVDAAYSGALKLSLAKDAINRTARVVSSATAAIYNDALRMLGRRLLVNFDDRIVGRRIYDASGTPGNKQQPGQAPSLPAYDAELEMTLRRLMDECYDESLEFLLGEGLWNFAARSVAIEHDPSVTPQFGYSYSFEKPTDIVRIIAISDTGTLWPTLGSDMGPAYLEEDGYYHANCDPLYLQYVSNDTAYGLNQAGWTPSFKKALAAYLAKQIAPHAGVSRQIVEGIDKELVVALRNARTKDAVDQASVRPPPGRFARSRSGSWRNVQRRENS